MSVVVRRAVLGRDRVESRQFDHEPRAPIHRIFRGQSTAVLLHDALTQIQTKPQSCRGLIAVRLHETIEDLVPPLDGHADAVVAHRDDRVAGVRRP